MNLQEAITSKTESENQLSLASMHYLNCRFQEATDIYKQMLIMEREYLALQVYVSLCYYKLDYYEVSNEILAPYLLKYPTSIIAVNLKAANMFKLYEGMYVTLYHIILSFDCLFFLISSSPRVLYTYMFLL